MQQQQHNRDCSYVLKYFFFKNRQSVALLTHGYRYKGSPVLDGAVCIILESAVFTVIGLTAEKLGLVVITLERYFKIVHAIAHRKHYRKPDVLLQTRNVIANPK